MRRGTPGAIQFGEAVKKIRTDAEMSCRDVAIRINGYAATVSQIEKGQRSLNKKRIPLWAKALEVKESYLRSLWLEADKLEEPPVIRRRAKSATAHRLESLIYELNGPERDRVLGYVTALIESRSPTKERA